MAKVCLVVVTGVLAPFLIWLMVPTLMCLAALVLFAVPVAALSVVFTRPRRAPVDSPLRSLSQPAPALE